MGALRRARARGGRRALTSGSPAGKKEGWEVLEHRAPVAALHGQAPEPHGRRLIRVCTPAAAAIVLGSTQRPSDFDAPRVAAAGLELAHRRSGGGAVLVRTADQLWVDIFLPAGDRLLEVDVARSFHFLGDAYAGAVRDALGPAVDAGEVAVHRGPMQRNEWSSILCFAGLGSGEVTVAGSKVVGMAQRRDRAGAWFHTVALFTPDQEPLAELLDRSSPRRSAARAALRRAGLPAAWHARLGSPQSLLERLLRHLP